LELDSCGKPEHLLHALELLWEEVEQELDGRGHTSNARHLERWGRGLKRNGQAQERLARQGLEWSTLLYSELHEMTARWQSRLALTFSQQK
jgi:hypothetical protein